MFTINKWTKMYIQGWFKNYGIMIVMVLVVALVLSAILIFSDSTKTSYIPTAEEQELIDKSHMYSSGYRQNGKVILTSDERTQLVDIRTKIESGIDKEIDPKPDSLTTKEYNILSKYKRYGADGKTFTPSFGYRNNGNPARTIDPLTDDDLSILATAKTKSAELSEWKYKNSSDSSSLLSVALILPVMFLFIFVFTMFGSRTDLGRISQIRDMEKRMQQIRKYGAEKFIEKSKAELVDGNEQGVELYVTNDVLPRENQGWKRGEKRPVYFVVYRDTSTGETYMSFTPDDIHTATGAMAWKQRLTVEQYEGMKLQS